MSVLNIKSAVYDNVAVIKIIAHFKLGVDAQVLHDAIEKYLSQGVRRFVLDLCELGNIDTVGFGELIAAFTRITSTGAMFAISGVKPSLARALKVSKLDTVFDAFPTVEEAERALRDRSLPILADA